jgi:chromosome segregation ATPase
MAEVEDVIAVRNLQVEYDRLTQDIPKKAGELSLLYKDIERAKSELKQLQDDQAFSKKETAQHIEDVEVVKRGLTQREEQHAEEIRRLETEHKYKTALTKDAVRELARINAQVLSAGEEYQKYSDLVADSEAKGIEHATVLGNVERAKQMLTFLESEKDKVLQDISTESQAWEGKLKRARDELSTLVHLAEEKRVEAEQSQARTKTYTDELYTHMNDYQIVKSRIAEVWKTTFPELELPL